MSLYVGSFDKSNIYDYQLKTSDSKNEKTDENSEVEKKKQRQVMSEVEGKYYCTYMVDDKGNKTLISKVPVDESPKANKSICDKSNMTALRINEKYNKTDESILKELIG